VSIKNKLVTAVTTAGLLAGLFGSAFVPAARAASAATGGITTSNGDGVVSSVQYFSSAVNPALSAAVDISAATDDGIFEVTISGGTFKSAAAAATGTGVGISGTVVSTTSISTSMAAANADNALTFTLVLNKLAAGSTATITIIDPDGDTLATMTATGRTAETGVISATKSTLAKNAAGDVTTTGGVEYIDASAALFSMARCSTQTALQSHRHRRSWSRLTQGRWRSVPTARLEMHELQQLVTPPTRRPRGP